MMAALTPEEGLLRAGLRHRLAGAVRQHPGRPPRSRPAALEPARDVRRGVRREVHPARRAVRARCQRDEAGGDGPRRGRFARTLGYNPPGPATGYVTFATGLLFLAGDRRAAARPRAGRWGRARARRPRRRGRRPRPAPRPTGSSRRPSSVARSIAARTRATSSPSTAAASCAWARAVRPWRQPSPDRPPQRPWRPRPGPWRPRPRPWAGSIACTCDRIRNGRARCALAGVPWR